MSKKSRTEEEVAPSDPTETTPPPPTNGDSEPAKKPPRDKAESFKRVGNQRLAKAMYAMKRLVPLANRNAYTYTDEQATKIKELVAMMAKDVATAFSTADTTAEPPASFF